MEKERLREILEELHESLGDVQELDEPTCQAMQTLTDDLQRLLSRSGSLSAADVEPVANRLPDLLLRFETEHPQITGILGRIASSLANLGI
jgi:hypothetical protein